MPRLTPSPVIDPEFINLGDVRSERDEYYPTDELVTDPPEIKYGDEFESRFVSETMPPWEESKRTPDFLPPPRIEQSLNLPPHVVMVTCRAQINGCLCILEAGKIINDVNLIKALLAAQAPIQAVNPDHEVLQCPHCRNLFEHAPVIRS